MRAIWSGSLLFGLIHIPVKLYSASKEQTVRFKLLQKHTSCPISYVRFCRQTNQEVAYRDIVRGYEYKKGQYVILREEDMRRVRPQVKKVIEITHFVDKTAIEAKYYHKFSYVEPGPRAQKAYVLLRAALKQTEQLAVGKFIFKNREYLVALEAEGKALLLHELAYAHEIRPPTSLRLPESAPYSEEELRTAVTLIERLRAPFSPHLYRDTYTEELRQIIKARLKGTPLPSSSLPSPPPAPIRELMTTLQRSLGQSPVKRRKTRTPVMRASRQAVKT